MAKLTVEFAGSEIIVDGGKTLDTMFDTVIARRFESEIGEGQDKAELVVLFIQETLKQHFNYEYRELAAKAFNEARESEVMGMIASFDEAVSVGKAQAKPTKP